MVKGYMSELDKYNSQIQDSIEPLESKLADGEKSEASLKPLIDDLAKRIDDYQKGVRMIKSAYESRIKFAIHYVYWEPQTPNPNLRGKPMQYTTTS